MFVSFPLMSMLMAMRVAYQSGKQATFRRNMWIPPLVAENPEKYGRELPVLYTNDPAAARAWAKNHIHSGTGTKIIGWDIENSQSLPWRQVSYEGPSTIQMAVPDAALVLQIAQEGVGPYFQLLPFIQEIMSNPTILKVGVGIDQDMQELYCWSHVRKTSKWTGEAVGRLDIGGIGGTLGSTKSLKAITKTICGVELQKIRKLTMSHWAKSPRLSPAQVAYAARDAWAAAAVISELSDRFPNDFSPDILAKTVLEKEMSICEYDERATTRKEARQALLNAISTEGGEKIPKIEWSDEQRRYVKELDELISSLAPPAPIMLDVE